MEKSFAKVWAELIEIYKDRQPERPFFNSRIKGSDIVRWSGYLQTSNDELYDAIALRIAEGYFKKELDFTLCDAIVNDIHSAITHVGGQRPDLFWRVYLAFDEGEYYHDDRRDVDPEELYTVPMIEAIIEEFPDHLSDRKDLRMSSTDPQ
ncbi:MAG: hypothetical protein ABSD67_10495 [Terracidiphilus sp.]